jgi:hypothetical protein
MQKSVFYVFLRFESFEFFFTVFDLVCKHKSIFKLPKQSIQTVLILQFVNTVATGTWRIKAENAERKHARTRLSTHCGNGYDWVALNKSISLWWKEKGRGACGAVMSQWVYTVTSKLILDELFKINFETVSSFKKILVYSLLLSIIFIFHKQWLLQTCF